MLAEIRVGLRAAGFEDGDVEPGFGEALAGPAAGGAGAYHDYVVFLRCRFSQGFDTAEDNDSSY